MVPESPAPRNPTSVVVRSGECRQVGETRCIRQMPGGCMSDPSALDEGLADDGAGDRHLRPLLIGLLLLIIVSGTIDLFLDAPDSWRSFHVLYEIALIAGALAKVTTVMALPHLKC